MQQTVDPMESPAGFKIGGDDDLNGEFIGLVAIFELAARQGWISQFERTVSHSYAGWNLWVTGIQGVFELLLKGHEPESFRFAKDAVQRYFRTEILLKYYPDPNEDLFKTFSLYERILRKSDIFDGQPIPRQEIKQSMHESYFTVAEITLAMARDDKAVGLRLKSQDEWRETRGSVLSARDHTGKIWRLAAGALDRRVPGWKIGMGFFSILVKACALRYGSPRLLLFSESKGRVWRVSGKQTKSRLSSRVLEKRLDAGFSYAPDPVEREKGVEALRLYLTQSAVESKPLRERSLRSVDSLAWIA